MTHYFKNIFYFLNLLHVVSEEDQADYYFYKEIEKIGRRRQQGK